MSVCSEIGRGEVAPFEPNDLDELTVGMSVNTSGANTPFNDVAGMITRSRSEGAAGHSLWYSHGVRDDYPAQLTAFYNVAVDGPAANPHFGSERRLPPQVASLVSAATGTWSVDVEAPAHYRVVAKVGTYWREVDQVTFDVGDFTVTVPGATQVELLVNRRPLDTPDFNGDGSVDAADYTLWRDTLGSSFDLRADANADGAVDIADYNLWKSGFGVPSTSGVIVVPEPTTLLLLLLGAATLFSRRSARIEIAKGCHARPLAAQLSGRSAGMCEAVQQGTNLRSSIGAPCRRPNRRISIFLTTNYGPTNVAARFGIVDIPNGKQ